MYPLRLVVLLASHLALAAPLLTQTSVQGSKAAKADFSKEAFIVQKLHVVASFEKDGTATREYSAVVQVLGEAGAQQFGVLKFQYAGANEEVEIAHVRVRKTDGTIVTTPAENIQDMPSEITRSAPFYSDLREKHIAVKGLSPGGTLEYVVRIRLRNPPIPGQFWFEYSFEKDSVVLDEQLTISFPKDIAAKVKSAAAKPTLLEQADRRVYIWKTTNLETLKKDDKNAPAEQEPDDEFPSVQLSSFADWNAVGRWYGTLQAERVVPVAAVKAKAAELTKGAANDEAKVRAIYGYVATKFRYIGVAFGIGRYQPHFAEEVLSNEYGDCKDKHTLLASLLKAAGIKAYPALISSGRKIDPEVPSPGQFNHVISAVPTGNSIVWLDTTPELAPFALLIAELRDKQALFIPEEGPATLVKTPADPPFKSLDNFEAEGKLDAAGTLEAKMKRTLRGDAELLFRLAFRRTPQTKWGDLVQSISYSSGFGGTVSNINISPVEATDSPFTITYDYTRKNYSDWENRRISPPLPPIIFNIENEEKRDSKPIVLGPLGVITYRAEIELPENLFPRSPEPVAIKRDFAEYRSSYRFYEGLLTAERHLEVKAREIPAAKDAEHREFAKAVMDSQTYLIVLARKLDSKTKPSEAAVGNEEANRLFIEGGAALQRGDIDKTTDLMNRTLALDPKHPGAWTGLGFAQMARGDVELGIASMRKQLEVTPQEPAGYEALAGLLMSMSRHDEAIAVIRGLLKAEPKNEVAAANLGRLLMEKKRYAEAATEMEAAAKMHPGSAPIQQTLGAAWLNAGDEERGMRALQAALSADRSPPMLNNVAYVLAEADRKLPDALAYAEQAVSAEERGTLDLRLDKLEMQDLARVWRIATFWDTLGWVHFRLGDLQKAEQYLRAAWMLSQSPPVGDHLGQVYEKKGQRIMAARYYAMAVAAKGGAPETRQRLHRLVGAARASQAIGRARQQLGQQRTSRVRPVKAVKGSAEFFVLFGPDGKVEDTRYASGSEGLRTAAESLRLVKYDVAIPPNSKVRLLRRGILMCTTPKLGCDFVLLTPDSVRSVIDEKQ